MAADRKPKWSLAWFLAFSLAWGSPGEIFAVQAQPYLRVHKDGVIYYYFSHRRDSQVKQLVYDSSRGRAASLPPGPTQKIPAARLEPLIQEISRNYQMPPALIKALIRVESNFNPHAVSPKGAQGLMQLMPQTADSLGVANPFDVSENVRAGTRYFWMLFHKFNQRLHLALAAYNAGPGRVEKCQQVPDIKETQDFVRNVCINYLRFEGEQAGDPSGQAASRGK